MPALITLLLLQGCGGDPEPAGDPESSTPTTVTTPDPPTVTAAPEGEAPPTDAAFPASVADDSGPAVAGATDDAPGTMRVTGLRLTSHAGYDRLVIDLSTAGVPDWTARYTEASGAGGGRVILPGDAYLRLGLFTQADPGQQTLSVVSAPSGAVAQARTTGFRGGYEEVLLGIRGGPASFRAFTLTDPGRVVVDVQRPG